MMDGVVLDPGHGGSQQRGKSSPQGARFNSGQCEKQVNLLLANRVAHYLGGARMTRRGDDNPSLIERIQTARGGNAQAFISLHTTPQPTSGGIWVHPRASQQSRNLAASIGRHLAPRYGGPVPVSMGELAVLSPDHHRHGIAACLVELALGDVPEIDRAAAAIARGVRGHLGSIRYGRGPLTHGLDLIDPPNPLPSDPAQAMQMINDWLIKRQHFITPIPDTTFFPFSAICRLELPNGNWGTGFYVSRDRILTAGHVLHDDAANGPVSSISVVPGKNGDGTEPFGRFAVSGADVIVHPSFAGASSDYDLGVLRVSQPPPNDRFFDLDSVPHSVGGVAICGYASGFASDHKHKQHIDTDFIREVSANGHLGDYGANTMGGTSGSPVFYTISVDDPQAQVSRIDIAAQGVHVDQYSVGSIPDGAVNNCVLLTDDKLNWLWSL